MGVFGQLDCPAPELRDSITNFAGFAKQELSDFIGHNAAAHFPVPAHCMTGFGIGVQICAPQRTTPRRYSG